MEIRNFIKIYDEILPWKVLSNLIRFLNTCSFEEAKVGADDHERVDFTIRKVHSFNVCNTIFERISSTPAALYNRSKTNEE